MEIISAASFPSFDVAKPASAGASPFSTCGLMATTQTVGLPFTRSVSVRVIFFARASFLRFAPGLGSTTVIGLMPFPSQPFNRADPMRPQPMSRITGSIRKLSWPTLRGPSRAANTDFWSELVARDGPGKPGHDSVIDFAGLRLAGAFQYGAGDGFFRRLAAPQHELEGGIIMLAGFQGQV